MFPDNDIDKGWKRSNFMKQRILAFWILVVVSVLHLNARAAEEWLFVLGENNAPEKPYWTLIKLKGQDLLEDVKLGHQQKVGFGGLTANGAVRTLLPAFLGVEKMTVSPSAMKQLSVFNHALRELQTPETRFGVLQYILDSADDDGEKKFLTLQVEVLTSDILGGFDSRFVEAPKVVRVHSEFSRRKSLVSLMNHFGSLNVDGSNVEGFTPLKETASKEEFFTFWKKCIQRKCEAETEKMDIDFDRGLLSFFLREGDDKSLIRALHLLGQGPWRNL